MPPTDTQSIEIVVNGEFRQAPAGVTLAQMLRFLEINLEQVAVEMNRVIVRKPDWTSTTVPPGARLEIVQFVGGG